MTRPYPPDLYMGDELDITPEGEKRFVVEARAEVSASWWATMLACILSGYGMEVEIRQIRGDEGEGKE